MIWINLIRVLTSLILTSGILIGIGFIVVQYLTNPFANLPRVQHFQKNEQAVRLLENQAHPS
ncbi:MAG: hypothetical protein LVT47_07550 [Cyanobacteria bacterium LVE1205-1]|jgi:hypothetical protein